MHLSGFISPLARQMRKSSQGSARSYSSNKSGRPRRGRYQRGRSRSQRGGYRGSGIEFTPVEKGFKYFKLSFIENPWMELEAERLASAAKEEEIPIDMDEVDSEGKDLCLPNREKEVSEPHESVDNSADKS